jgi:integrase/recombinase XerD
LADGRKMRESLGLRSWEAGQAKMRELEAQALLPEPEKLADVTVKDAVSRFTLDLKAQNLVDATLKKHRCLLDRRLLTFCAAKGFIYVRQLTVDVISEFRETWTTGPHPEGMRTLGALESGKTLERLRSFFRFCQSRKYIADNPASALKAPKVPDNPTLPFTKDEMEKILWACDLFATGGRYQAKNRTRVKAAVLLMRFSGLAIRDAVTLERSRIIGNRLFLYRAKTGVPVNVLLPDKVLAALNELDDYTERYFWNGAGKVESVVGVWERTFKRLFEIAGIESGHAHRFRDTFAVELLQKNVPIEQVSRLLGHSSIKTTERHYAPWVQSRQDALEEAVKRTWD